MGVNKKRRSGYQPDPPPRNPNPDPGYYFSQWSDGSTANPRTDSNVSGNVNVSAIFHDYSETWVNFANTGAEDGSLARPFNTIHEGVGAVLGGGTVRILSGSTASAIRITKPMRIESSGGTATIGR